MQEKLINGLLAPMLTPFNDDLTIAGDLYVAHAHSLLDQGCSGLVPFGTTGEALSVGIEERIAGIEQLLDGGVEPAVLIPGTGLTNIADTARLSRACLDFGCAGVLTLPPFFFKDVAADALYQYFAQLVRAIGPDARIYLYHIPPIAIVGIPPSVVQRLFADFPEQIVGVKDSSGDWDNTCELLKIDGLGVYPGSELPLLDAVERGAAGCISATANVNAAQIASVINLVEQKESDAARELHNLVSQFRLEIQKHKPIPAQKRLLAMSTGDTRWANVRPPLTAMTEQDGRQLADTLRRIFEPAE